MWCSTHPEGHERGAAPSPLLLLVLRLVLLLLPLLLLLLLLCCYTLLCTTTTSFAATTAKHPPRRMLPPVVLLLLLLCVQIVYSYTAASYVFDPWLFLFDPCLSHAFIAASPNFVLSCVLLF